MKRPLRWSLIAAAALLALAASGCNGDDGKATPTGSGTAVTTPQASGTSEPGATQKRITLEDDAAQLATGAAGALLDGNVERLMGYFAEEARSDQVRAGFETIARALQDANLRATADPTITGAGSDDQGQVQATVTVPTTRGNCELRVTMKKDGEWSLRRLTLVTEGGCWPLTVGS